MKTKKIRIEIKNKEGGVLFKREASQFPLIIGRKAPADIIIENAFVSNSHCRVRRVGEKFLFEDLNSTNGSFVGRKKIENFEIDDVANIRIGTEIFLFFSIPVQELEIEEKTRVPIPPTSRDDILVRQPQQFTLMEYNSKPIQFFKDLDHFLLPVMDQSYKSFITFYFMTGTLFSTLFLVFIEKMPLLPAVLHNATYLSLILGYMIIPAAVLCLPGWAFKRESSFKKIYYSLILSFLLFCIQNFVLLPFTVAPATGLVIKILCSAFLALGVFLVGYVTLGSLFNKKWTHRLALVLTALLIIPSVLMFSQKKALDQQYAKRIFESERIGLLSLVPVRQQSVDEATAALVEFDKTLRAPAQSPSN